MPETSPSFKYWELSDPDRMKYGEAISDDLVDALQHPFAHETVNHLVGQQDDWFHSLKIYRCAIQSIVNPFNREVVRVHDDESIEAYDPIAELPSYLSRLAKVGAFTIYQAISPAARATRKVMRQLDIEPAERPSIEWMVTFHMRELIRSGIEDAATWTLYKRHCEGYLDPNAMSRDPTLIEVTKCTVAAQYLASHAFSEVIRLAEDSGFPRPPLPRSHETLVQLARMVKGINGRTPDKLFYFGEQGPDTRELNILGRCSARKPVTNGTPDPIDTTKKMMRLSTMSVPVATIINACPDP